ncbi:MAG: hypothetical protein ACYC0M_15730 [Burkholderiales bacterium]
MIKGANIIQLSSEAKCAKTRFTKGKIVNQTLFPVASKKKEKELWLEKNILLFANIRFAGNFTKRVVTPVRVENHDEDLYMDAITGSLFKKSTGECLSSSQISIKGKPVVNEKCAQTLLSITGDD